MKKSAVCGENIVLAKMDSAYYNVIVIGSDREYNATCAAPETDAIAGSVLAKERLVRPQAIG